MSRDHVLAGLGDKYDLTRIDDPKSDLAQYGGEYWMIWPKSDAKSQVDRESGAVRFFQGKASSIEIETYSSITDESARFAEHLFWLLYSRADPSARPDKDAALDSFYKDANARWITVPMQLRDSHGDKHEELEMLFALGGQHFSISIGKRPGQPITCGSSRLSVVQQRIKSNLAGLAIGGLAVLHGLAPSLMGRFRLVVRNIG